MSAIAPGRTTERDGAPVFCGAGRRRLVGATGLLGAVVVWWLLAHFAVGNFGQVNGLTDPTRLAGKVVSYAMGAMLADMWASLQVFLGGWLSGGLAATIVGVLLGRVRAVRELFLPVVQAARPAAGVAWIPLSVIWVGSGAASRVLVVAVAVFLVVVVYAIDGSSRIPADVRRAAAMLGMTRARRLRHVVLPATLGEVLAGLRVAVTVGWGTVVIAELVGVDSGLGARLISARQGYDVPAVMATMLCFAVTGFALHTCFSFVAGRLTPWREPRAGAGGLDDLVVGHRSRGRATGPRGRRALLAAAGVTLLVGAWHLVVWLGWVGHTILPAPWSVVQALAALAQQPTFWSNLGVSLWQLVAGFGIGAVLGVAIGLATNELAYLRMALHPLTRAFSFVAPAVWIPLALLWFGTSYLGKILLAGYAVYLVMVVSTARALRDVDPRLTEVATMLGVSGWRQVFAVRLRAGLPGIADATRAAAAAGWLVVIGAEYVGSSAGLGHLVITATASLNMPFVTAGVLVIVAVGAFLASVIGRLARIPAH